MWKKRVKILLKLIIKQKDRSVKGIMKESSPLLIRISDKI